jgi:hypothetical protein
MYFSRYTYVNTPLYLYTRNIRGPLSLVSTNEELLGRNSSDCSLENQEYGRGGSAGLTT